MLHAQDFRYAIRQLLRTPGFTLLTVVVLAGGLGVSTFAFSFLYTAMVRPLPLPEGDRIVRLSPTTDGRSTSMDLADVARLREGMQTVVDMGAYSHREIILGRKGEGRMAKATMAEPVLFKVARTSAHIGRVLQPGDALASAEPVAVLSHATWKGTFRASPRIIDSLVNINGVPTRIVGVMPEGFGFPVVQELWLPMPDSFLASVRPGREFGYLFARLQQGATHEQASAEGAVVRRRILATRDTSGQRVEFSGMEVESFPAAQIGEDRTVAFTALNALAILILLLALTNVSMLLMARANERIRETAVRMALGASTARLVVQGMWEGVILCVAGGILGTAGVAAALNLVTRWTQANIADNMAFWWVWQLDHVTMLSATTFIAVAVVVLGALVSFRAARINVREVMQDGGARTGSRRDGRLARAMVVLQVTTVTVLMFVGVLSGVVANRVVQINPGFDPRGLLQTAFVPTKERFADSTARNTAFVDVHRQLSVHQGVERVMLRDVLASKQSAAAGVITRSATVGSRVTSNIVATLGDLATMNIALVDGRTFDVTDDAHREPVAMVSASFARSVWNGRSPVGDQVRLASVGDSAVWRTIVGVVSDLPYGNVLSRERSTDAVYVPLLQLDDTGAEVVVRARSGEGAAREAIYETFVAVDPDMVPQYVHRVEELMQKSGMIAIGLTKLFGGCFLFALLLAVAGTYGLMSRSIALRTREIGVRRALGASDALAARMVLAQAARQLGIGTLIAIPVLLVAGIGIVRTIQLERAVVTAAGVGVSVSILAVVLAATWLPVRRVVRVRLVDALGRE
jgi:predicted permease